eukprot:4877471-Pleurochrysis_carterae.AAC.2
MIGVNTIRHIRMIGVNTIRHLRMIGANTIRHLRIECAPRLVNGLGMLGRALVKLPKRADSKDRVKHDEAMLEKRFEGNSSTM